MAVHREAWMGGLGVALQGVQVQVTNLVEQIELGIHANKAPAGGGNVE